MIKNHKYVVLLIALLAVFGFFNTAQAATVAELQTLINQLLAQVAQLQAQIATMQGGQTAWCHTFNINLRYGDVNDEVNLLQLALDKQGLYVSPTDRGSVFGDYTASAVTAFQEKYRSEILGPYGLKNGTGFVGISTRAKLNKLYGCAIEPIVCGVECPQLTPIGITYEEQMKMECQIKGGKWEAIIDKCGCVGKPQCIMSTTTCIQVITPAKNPYTNECKNFPTPCEVPKGWNIVSSCASSSISIIYPNGGEQLQVGKTYDITWKSSGINKINIYIDGGCTSSGLCEVVTCDYIYPEPKCKRPTCQSKLIAQNVDASLGKYSWIIPSSQTLFTDASIYIQESVLNPIIDSCLIDKSDNYFRIVAATTF